MTPELDRLLSADLAGDLAPRPLGELRDLCRQNQEWETAVSLTRRLAQGRLDVLRYEAGRRRSIEDQGPTGDPNLAPSLLFDLPDILADEQRGSGGRALDLAPPGPSADALGQLLDQSADPGLLGRPADLADEQLAALTAGLARFEQQLSGLRRALHAQIDVLRAEIGRRYRDGEATVESVLG